MQQIFIANPKGGCGKTMISVHLAGYYAKRGLKVALCDHDPQRSALDWLHTRPEDCERIEGIQYFQHHITTHRFDVMIHDMPAASDLNELATLSQSHQLIIPVLPSPSDIKACVRFLMAINRADMVGQNKNKIGLVANRVNVRTNYFKVLLTFLNQVNLPLVGYLRDTQNYVRAFSAGASLFDLPPRTLGQDLSQWQPILEWLDNENINQTHPLMHDVTTMLSAATREPKVLTN